MAITDKWALVSTWQGAKAWICQYKDGVWAARDKNINELGAKCADLQAKMERAARDQRSAERERSALLEDVESERKRLRATIDDFAARTKESVERRDRAEAQTQSTLQDLAEKEQEMAIARAELADRVTHLQVRSV